MATLKPVLPNSQNIAKVTNSAQNVEPSSNNTQEDVTCAILPDYPFVINIGGHIYHYRKWKVKDLKQYRDLGKDTGVFDKKKARDILVNNIIYENVVLDVTQYAYALLIISQTSIPNKLPYRFECSNCKQEYDYHADFSKICTLKFNGFSSVKISSDVIEFCELKQNSKVLQEYYELKLDDENKDDFALTDMICHIKNINGKELKPSELLKYFDDLDMDDFSKVLNAYKEMKYTLDFISEVECPLCHHKVQMLFDEMPKLIPDEFSNNLEKDLLKKLRQS